MTAIDRTAYPRFRAPLTPSELHEHFTPTAAEMALAEAQTPDAAGKLAFLVLYKCMQTLNYLPGEEEIPPEVIEHLRWYLQLDDRVRAQVSPRSRRRYGQIIRQAIGLKYAVQEALHHARTAMEQAALVRDHPADLINAALETLLKQWYEFPAFSALDRLAGTVRAEVNERWCTQILARIPTAERQRLEQILETPDGASDYTRLKETPKSATLSHLDEWFARLRWLHSFGNVAAWIQDVPVLKIHHLAAEARTLDVAELRDHTLPRRLALVASLLYYTQIQTRDELVTMLIKRVAAIHHQAREHLERLLQQERATMERWMQGFAEITRSVAEGADDPTLGQVARAVVDRVGGPAQFLTTYETLATYHGNNYLPLMSSVFGAHRAALFRVLRALDLHSTSQDQTLVKAVAYVLANEKRRVKYLPPVISLDFATEQWQRTVRTKQDGKLVYERARLEMCVFTCVANEFKSGDLALAGSLEYADLREQLLPWEQCETQVADYCLQLTLPPDGKTLVETLRGELTSLAEQVDRRLPDGQVTISDTGEIRLKRMPTQRPSKAIRELDAAVAQKLKPRSVLEILKNAHYYANWTRHFGPLSGSEAKVSETVARYITLAFCYGGNLGPAQTARHLRQAISAHEISYTNRRHVTATLIDRGITDVNNVYARCALPLFWGTGQHAAADGTKLELARENLIAEPHFRYGGWGGIRYAHIADTYIALFTHFLTCGTWEGLYIIDGLMRNQSTIQPKVLHADTQGQTTTVFAMAYLLGIQLMPRIRHWKELVFYRPSKDVTYRNIDALFKETIDWQLIETHWPDLMQVVLSIKAGKVLPSAILRRLINQSHKNRLFQVFQEVGRVLRTLFLLRYISNRPLREGITQETNKVESYHAFAEWLSFGNLGRILDNDPVEMEKQVKYNHLLANCVMLQNVLDMSQALRELLDEGYPVTPQTVQGLSAYVHGHIRRYGDYELEVEEVPPPISEEALTTLFERIRQRGAPAAGAAEATGAEPELEAP
jgi:TnpA family transposase